MILLEHQVRVLIVVPVVGDAPSPLPESISDIA